ncbi:hypothetical protein TWF730_003323 [Orbilia blumenaviensis]|uniref:FAD-binding PCMH-type domain-containing protein n=1 Tax=Orbilia blumenaviensis TaxID=1796055 RepID=A0AAV9U5L3_9PEZI
MAFIGQTTKPGEDDKRDPNETRKRMRDFADYLKSESVPIYLPGEPEYERSVATSNLLYRFARPGCVVQPLSTSDVQTVVREAKLLHIPMTIKCGGHSYSGFSTAADNSISLDLGKMNRARLDTRQNPPVMVMQGGAQWGHAYKHLINGKHDGYIVNGGRCPTVGVAGFILGGGLAPFGRKFGLGSDTLIEATIVTVDGEIVTVSRADLDTDDNDPDKHKVDKKNLFWALCGAGGGNFGIVVEFKLEVHKLDSPNGVVVAGKYEWQPELKAIEGEPLDGVVASQGTIDTMNRFYTYNWPNECTIDSSWISAIGKPLTIRLLVYYDGIKKDFINLIEPAGKDAGGGVNPIINNGLRDMLKRRMIEEPSSRFLHETLVDQWSEEIVKAFPQNKSYSLHASFVFENTTEVIENVIGFINGDMWRFQDRYAGENAKMQVTWIHSGGKTCDIGYSKTAYPWRKGVYNVYILLEWDGKWLEMDMRGWLQKFREALKKFSIEGRAAYVNFPFPSLPTEVGTNEKRMSLGEYEDAYYGDNSARLREVKLRWDPTKYFNWSQGVQLPEEYEKERSARLQPTSLRAQGEATEGDGNTVYLAAMTTIPKPVKASDRAFADRIAQEQWKTFVPVKPLSIWPSSGIHALTDLGF